LCFLHTEVAFSMPYHKGELDYLAPAPDSEAMLELKEMQRTLPWQNYPIPYYLFIILYCF
jgi:hypothetical protein